MIGLIIVGPYLAFFFLPSMTIQADCVVVIGGNTGMRESGWMTL